MMCGCTKGVPPESSESRKAIRRIPVVNYLREDETYEIGPDDPKKAPEITPINLPKSVHLFDIYKLGTSYVHHTSMKEMLLGPSITIATLASGHFLHDSPLRRKITYAFVMHM